MLVKPLNGLVQKSDVIETERLTTLIVVVPNDQCKVFEEKYEFFEDDARERHVVSVKRDEEKKDSDDVSGSAFAGS